MKSPRRRLAEYVHMLVGAASQEGRNLSMSITPRYETPIQNYLGYDQQASWMVIEDLMWLYFLNMIGFAQIRLRTSDVQRLFRDITTKKQDWIESNGMGPKKLGRGHDVLSLLQLMYGVLPPEAHQFVHFGKTSYDKICTAQALMHVTSFREMMVPAMRQLDEVWRKKIGAYASVIQMGRSHLQDGLPVTVGFWLSVLHDRFLMDAEKAAAANREVTGCATGGMGTSASYHALGIIDQYQKLEVSRSVPSYEEYFLCNMLGLGKPRLSTQIVQPELLTRYFFELVMLSGALANLGEDGRILQSSAVSELISQSSSSSTMAHKRANPVGFENLAGMHTTVIGEFMKPLQNQVSDLQRDLRGSGPARDYVAIPAYVYYQINRAIKVLESLDVNGLQCRKNFEHNQYVIMGELLHLSLMNAGMSETHEFVNKKVVPEAMGSNCPLTVVMDVLAKEDSSVASHWNKVPGDIKAFMVHPEQYVGLAVHVAKTQSTRVLDI